MNRLLITIRMYRGLKPFSRGMSRGRLAYAAWRLAAPTWPPASSPSSAMLDWAVAIACTVIVGLLAAQGF